MERGDFALAEQTARGELRLHPQDALAWSVLGASLDKQGKFPEAEDAHRRAVGIASGSADVLNNYGNHQLAAGQPAAARATYQKVLALDAGNLNANVQLARLALSDKDGSEASRYLRQLPAVRQNAPAIAALRLAARSLSGDRAALGEARGNLGLSFTAGVALANAGHFERAEEFLALALGAAPADFNVLFNLGVVATRAGHTERARDVLQAARRQQPQNVDVLYNLAFAERVLQQREAALATLVQAAKLAPRRADVQKLLAITASDLGALEDSAAAWDRYLKLQPDDDAAHRERAFLDVEMGQFERGVAGLQAYGKRHPDDPDGHFELGMAQSKDDAAQALPQFDRALQIQPDFAAARAARGSLYYQMGKPEAALPDLEAAAALRPGDAASLDRLGQTYLALDRPSDAVRVLRRAAELAPDDSKTQLHFARALADAGQAAESKAAMERFRRLGPTTNKAVPAGLVDYLSLTPAQRRADYRARVEKAVREHPEDAAAQVAFLKLRLEDGKTDEAAAAASRIAALKPAAALLVDAARALLESRQFGPAKELLQAAGTSPDGAAAAGPELAIAEFQMLDAGEKTPRPWQPSIALWLRLPAGPISIVRRLRSWCGKARPPKPSVCWMRQRPHTRRIERFYWCEPSLWRQPGRRPKPIGDWAKSRAAGRNGRPCGWRVESPWTIVRRSKPRLRSARTAARARVCGRCSKNRFAIGRVGPGRTSPAEICVQRVDQIALDPTPWVLGLLQSAACFARS